MPVATYNQLDRDDLIIPPKHTFELGRLHSFNQWPHQDDTICAKEKMAKAGFYYTGKKDCVKCFVCRIKLEGWDSKEDEPWQKHLENSPDCLFAKIGKEECSMSVEQLLDVLCDQAIHTFDSKINSVESPEALEDITRECAGLKLSDDQSVQKYDLEADRLRSFTDQWPHPDHSSCSKKKMAKAGFYPIGEDDCVKCFVCMIQLEGWNPKEDEPWQKHRKESPDCKFAKIGKEEGDMFVEEWLDVFCDQAIHKVESRIKSVLQS